MKSARNVDAASSERGPRSHTSKSASVVGGQDAADPGASRGTDGAGRALDLKDPTLGDLSAPSADDTGGAQRRRRSHAHPATDTEVEIARSFLGEVPSLTMHQLAGMAGTTLETARSFWRSMGFANVADDAATFAPADVEALRRWLAIVDDEVVDEATMMSLVRAQAYNTERLAVWQMESVVEDLQRRIDLDDVAARIVILDRLSEYVDFTTAQLDYAWRRQMAALALRTLEDITARGAEEPTRETLPLPRALGFVDMVAFTSTARQLGSRGLADLVQGFEFTARDVVTANGGRVVKTVGDAVLYIADDLLTAAKVALAMIDAISGNPRLLPVRASLVWGRVVSRSGDIFGPAVNLASRLIDVAPKNTVYMDETTAALFAKHPRAGDFHQDPQQPVNLQGIGTITPIQLRWASRQAREQTWRPSYP